MLVVILDSSFSCSLFPYQLFTKRRKMKKKLRFYFLFNFFCLIILTNAYKPVLLFHGVLSDAASMTIIGERIKEVCRFKKRLKMIIVFMDEREFFDLMWIFEVKILQEILKYLKNYKIHSKSIYKA